MKAIAALTLLLFMTSCAPLIVGTAAGLIIANHENHRAWCQQFYGNPWCYRNGWPTAYTYRMP